MRFEVPIGHRGVLQRQSDGLFIPSASFAWGLSRFGLEPVYTRTDIPCKLTLGVGLVIARKV